ncbi:MAG: hypothetical protein MUC94_14690 [bacterium]|nr:hypothetical protein [bacterium]
MADDGTLGILDPVNQRVQLFSPDGNWIGKFAIAINAFDIQFQNQELLILAPYDHAVIRYSRFGKLIEKMAIDRNIELIDGLHTRENEVFVQTIEQIQYSITKNQVQQIESAKQGASTRIPGVRIRTQWINAHQGNMIIEDERTGKAQSITIASQDELGSLVFLDSDMNGNIFVRKELFSAAGKPYFEVAKFDRNGALLTAIKIEHENIVTPFKPITVDKHGNVYFLEIQSDGFSVIRWQEEE